MKVVSVQLDHLFATVFRIADQALPQGVDDEIQVLQRNLADQHGAVIGHFRDTYPAFAALDRESHRTEHVHLTDTVGGP